MFRACCQPLLWTTVPEQAWDNGFFQDNWHKHGSKIRFLQCGPGVDLVRVALYCRDLVSLDISCKRGLIATKGGRIVSGCPAVPRKQPSAQDDTTNFKDGRQPTDVDSYKSFMVLATKLVRVIHSNQNLQCLQFRPSGRIPSMLLEALAQQERLRVLSLNGWQDFQEYSLELIMEACPQLSHLSLGENDFTRFTLQTIAKCASNPHTDSLALSSDSKEAMIRFEPYDDPIKTRSGPYSASQDLLDTGSKQAVLYTPAPTLAPKEHAVLQKGSLANQQSPLSPMDHGPSALTPWSQIKSLSLCQAGLRQEFLVNLVRMCPSLEHLSLLDGWGFYPTSRFASVLSQVCPHLRRFEFREQALDLQDEFFASLCSRFPRLEWIHAGKTGFSHSALDSVRLLCKDIVSLNLDGARGVQSTALAKVLSTCGSLKALSAHGVVLNGHDLNNGPAWACHGLETLVLDIEIYATSTGAHTLTTARTISSIQSVRERIYDRLAALKRLQMLGLGGGHAVGTERGIDLTLASGLAKLTSLECLERLDIRRLARAIGQADFVWMVRHWPRFRQLDISKRRASSNTLSDNTNKAIEWLTHARPGMDIRLY
ncbi:hypothetical protein BGZ75_003274 [Mortierella antarctica]|nr:hypothetical protein BGZ75_003274 [Mortierella antarctica]